MTKNLAQTDLADNLTTLNDQQEYTIQSLDIKTNTFQQQSSPVPSTSAKGAKAQNHAPSTHFFIILILPILILAYLLHKSTQVSLGIAEVFSFNAVLCSAVPSEHSPEVNQRSHIF